MKTETAKLKYDSLAKESAGWAGMRAAKELRDHSVAEPQPNTKKIRSPQKGAKGSTGRHSLRSFAPSALFRGQEFLAKESDSDGQQCKEETVFSAFLAMPYVRLLAGREDFSGTAGARPSWPQQPRTLAPLRSNPTHLQNRTRCGQDGRAPMRWAENIFIFLQETGARFRLTDCSRSRRST